MNTFVRWPRGMKYVLFIALFAVVLNRTAANDVSSLTFLAVALFFFLAVGTVVNSTVRSIRLKQSLIDWFGAGHRPARPHELDGPGRAELERLTRQWESLGFVQRGDFVTGGNNLTFQPLLSRLFKHQTQGAVVEVIQSVSPLGAVSFSSSIESFWGEREPLELRAKALERTPWTPAAPFLNNTPPDKEPSENDISLWMLATHNLSPNRYGHLTRHPRILTARLHTSATPAQLWQLHQERCALVEARLHSPPLRGDLARLMYDHARVLHALAAHRLQSTPAWKMLRDNFAPPHPTPEFSDGDLAPLGG